MDDRPDVAHGRVDTLAPPEVSNEERDKGQSLALVAGEHAHLASAIDQPGNDT